MIDYPIESRRSLLAKHFLLRHMPEELLAGLARFTTLRRLAAEETLFRKGDPGDGLYGVLDGRVRIHMVSRNGRTVILNILDKGEIFGEIALIDGHPRTADATTMEPTALLHIHRNHFLPFLRQDADLCITLLSTLCSRVRWQSGWIEDAAFLEFPARLAKRLIGLGQHYGESHEGGVRITIKLTQAELGNMLGATREAVNKHLSLWRAEGLIDLEKGRIVLRDREALAALID
jgi:CRP/FNR family cyclic AMP-dependent transcriptional regulator